MSFSQDVLQSKSLSFSYALRTTYEGYEIIFQYWSLALCNLFRKNKKKFLGTNEDNVSLAWGFHILSRLCSSYFVYGITFIFDIRLGLEPSRGFTILIYSLISMFTVLSILVSSNLYVPIFQSVITDPEHRSSKLINATTKVVILSYGLYGMSNLYYIVYKRKFIYDFVVHRCACIALPANFQSYHAADIFVWASLSSLLAEPMFILLMIFDLYEQPKYLPDLTKREFFYAKFLLLFVTLPITAVASMLQNLIPICSMFLMTMSERYVSDLTDKHFGRINKESSAGLPKESTIFERQLLSPHSMQILAEFNCSTICSDWPKVPVVIRQLGNEGIKIQQQQPASSSHAKAPRKQLNNGHQFLHATGDWSNQQGSHSLIVGSRVFLYKNLIKGLIELKTAIQSWESQFGLCHVMMVYLNGLLVAQWVVVGWAELRRDSTLDQINIFKTPLFIRTCMSLVVFVVTNMVVFHKCDILPRRMQILRQKLIKLNLDLVKLSETGDDGRGVSSTSDRTNSNSSNRKTLPLASHEEVQLVWSLFDQADRILKQVNFKYSGNIEYSKRCLINIFSREASLILLYLQVIDVYTSIQE